MSAVIGSNLAARIAGFANAKALEKRAVRASRYKRPLRDFFESRKKLTQFTGGEVLVPIKEPAYNLSAQKWSGSDTLNNPVELNPGMLASFTPSNMFWPVKWGFDELRKVCGVTIIPNENGAQSADARVYHRDKASERILYDKLAEDIESEADRADENVDVEMHRQGSTAKDLAGLNSILPIQNIGNYGGIDRAKVAAVQHVLFAGNDGNGTAPKHMGARGIVGTNGTLLGQLETFIRQLRSAAATCGLPSGRWKAFAGTGFLDKYKFEMRRIGIQWNMDASKNGGKLNLLLTDDRLGVDDFDLAWNPTMDQLDTIAASEVGLGLSQLSVTFSGGGATRQATAVAYVSAGGGIASIVVTDAGEGYTSAPTVTIGNAGGGSAATFQAYVFSASTGTGLTQVDGDDVRLGRLNYVAVTAAGSGYPTTGTAAPFTDRLIALYEPSWEYLVQNGLDMRTSIPADNPRARYIEQQRDHTHCLVCKCPRVNGIIVASST